MMTVNATQFRNNMAAMLNMVDAGEKVVVTRNNRRYYLRPERHRKPDNTITPELARAIEEAREDARTGNVITLRSHEDIQAFWDSL